MREDGGAADAGTMMMTLFGLGLVPTLTFPAPTQLCTATTTAVAILKWKIPKEVVTISSNPPGDLDSRCPPDFCRDAFPHGFGFLN